MKNQNVLKKGATKVVLKPSQENTREIKVLLIMKNNPFLEKTLIFQLRKVCTLTQVTTFKEVDEVLESGKDIYDLVIINSMLEDTKVDTIKLAKKIRTNFKAQLISTGNQWKQLIGTKGCENGCLPADLIVETLTLIEEMHQNEKKLEKQKEINFNDALKELLEKYKINNKNNKN